MMHFDIIARGGVAYKLLYLLLAIDQEVTGSNPGLSCKATLSNSFLFFVLLWLCTSVVQLSVSGVVTPERKF